MATSRAMRSNMYADLQSKELDPDIFEAEIKKLNNDEDFFKK